MRQDVRELVLGGVRKDRHRDPAERHAGKHRHRPVRHVLGIDGYLVSGADAVAVEAMRQFQALMPERLVRIFLNVVY